MTPDELIGRLFVDIAIVVVVARLFALALRKLHEPPVMAEILAGIALGPTLLGALPGHLSADLFPKEVRGALAAVGSIGLVLFMFIIGLELNLSTIRKYRRMVPAISLGALALPLTIGVGLAFMLFGSHSVVGGHTVSKLSFVLFIAVALSITAFPVLARILIERGLDRTPLGGIALAAAAVQDTAGWILLTVALVVHSGGGSGEMARILAETTAYVAVMLLVVRPLLQRLVVNRHADGPIGLDTVALVVAGLLASAGATQLIGLHSVLGAFFFGAIFPRRRADVADGLVRALRPATMAILPIYFLVPGLNVNIGGIGGNRVGEVLLIIACAAGAKLLGAGLGARASGLEPRPATMMGVLMNTRGLIELIVLNVALSAGILDQRLYSELVVMALVTTLMAPPLLDFVRSYRPRLALGTEPLLTVEAPPERSA